MLLRSSSTPVLGSLLSPIQEGPSSNHETNATFKHHLPPPSPTTTIHHSHSYNKLSCAAFNIPTVSCHSSPRSSPSAADHKGIRRAQSEGNLAGLAHASCKDEEEHLYNANQPNSNKRVLGRYKCSVLKSIPSFSSVDEDDEELLQNIRRGGGGETVTAAGGGEFRLNNGMAGTALSEEVKVMEALWNVGFEEERGTVGQEMYLAKGLGVGGRGGGRGGRGGGTGGGGGGFYPAGSGGDSQGVEEYYKKMVEENPGNPLFLSNYAQFLYQSKQDLPKAEEYYSRAILADPGDGEILSQYAKLVWELHNDQDRAATYYERAVHASPEDRYKSCIHVYPYSRIQVILSFLNS
ncbi:TPR REGION domain-containing protein [Citrus sinensis]|uniref:TPR REGION domain-containing protein n=1 Tax=Citrus sinensis TaxID=2711 RepID=A0ACB8MI91_CITSI|nr:TPR REGION domain-containing protein [Citrus sinensis]